jgi:tRNA modification GTPase
MPNRRIIEPLTPHISQLALSPRPASGSVAEIPMSVTRPPSKNWLTLPHPSMAGPRVATIAALATPPGESALAIVRATGPLCETLAARVLRAPRNLDNPAVLAPRQVTHVAVVEPGESTASGALPTVLDDATAVLYPAEMSPTGEPLLEITTHGGLVTPQAVLGALYAAGAQPAGPGEFTRRAFLAGRVSLAEAEAVQGLIHAQSERAARLALRQLRGGLRDRLGALSATLQDQLALIEAFIDFPDERLPVEQARARLAELDRAIAALDELITRTDATALERTGLRVVLAGLPNAGKSSLFNALTGRDRALTSPVPGTTRDVLEATVVIGGQSMTLVDTAGLRDVLHATTHSPRGLLSLEAAYATHAAHEATGLAHAQLEGLGIEKTRSEVAVADAVIWVVDGRHGLTASDRAELDWLHDTGRTPVAVVATHGDLFAQDQTNLPGFPHAFTVALPLGEGLAAVRGFLARLAATTEGDEPFLLFARHRDAALRARTALQRARDVLAPASDVSAPNDTGSADELAASDLRDAILALSEIDGDTGHPALTEALLDRIFSRFCIGK